jgi:MoxR-like ATPase
MSRQETREKFYSILSKCAKAEISVTEIQELCNSAKINFPQWFTKDPDNRISRGLYKNPQYKFNSPAETIALAAQVLPMTKPTAPVGNRISNVVTDLEVENLVPEKYKNYVPFGNFSDIVSIVESKQFFPIFITGQSGNGKTMSVEQACAKLGRKFICVSMTPETDEGDLLGNFVLINGQMEWRDGPVTVAARQGAVLCIDEIDYGAQNLSVLQRVLEGKSFLLKKKNEMVAPAPGFTIVATANTKGKGSEDGRYMFTNVLNEAFLERFLNTFEQEWPPVAVEKKIVTKELEKFGRPDAEFAEKLVNWADVIRKTFDDGGCDEVISTRRLVHIAKSYGVYGDRIKSIEKCLNRFDEDTKVSFMDLYSKLNEEVKPDVVATANTATPLSNEEIPF